MITIPTWLAIVVVWIAVCIGGMLGALWCAMHIDKREIPRDALTNVRIRGGA